MLSAVKYGIDPADGEAAYSIAGGVVAVVESAVLGLLGGPNDIFEAEKLMGCEPIASSVFFPLPSQFNLILKSHSSPCFSQFRHFGRLSSHLTFRFLHGLS
jgi:hypothetical protein